MECSARAANLEDIQAWREMYRLEMGCQIIHDSIHYRRGWTQEYLLAAGTANAGYGSVAIGGPWTGKPTVYEFYVVPKQRLHVFDLFGALLDASGADAVEVQSNDALSAAMLHAFAQEVTSESVLFHDHLMTEHRPKGAIFREPSASEAPEIQKEQLRWHGVVELDGQVVAKGGILFHYNPPYGDIFMDVLEPFRRRGFGSFLVQELKGVCYAGGYLPGARCSLSNVASRRTLQKAGFVPCAHMLIGRLSK